MRRITTKNKIVSLTYKTFSIGLSGNPYGGAYALYWNLGGEWIYKKWKEKVIPEQIKLGIEGHHASSMPFK